MRRLLNDPLNDRSIPVILGFSSLALVLANRLHLALCQTLIDTPCVAAWPISQFMFRLSPKVNDLSPVDLLVAVGCLAGFFLVLRLLARYRYLVWMVALLGLALILGTTLTHGVDLGLARPIASTDLTKAEYLEAAAAIEDPFAFVRGFEALQPSLLGHSGTHPPGAVLFFYFLHGLVRDPVPMALLITGLSVILAALTLRAALVPPADDLAVGRTLFLFLLLPAIQIYFSASLDALIAPLMLGCCLDALRSSRWRLVVSTACLLIVSGLTFTFVFVLPVLAVMQARRGVSLLRLSVQLGALAVFWLLIERVLGFNYLNSFAIATAHENPAGFLLLASPGDYLMTRLEDVAEILLFLGPFAALIIARGLRRSGPWDEASRLGLLALGSLLLVFLSGAYRTGETARGALYIYPFLVLPLASQVSQPGTSDRYNALATLVFAQSLLMQLVGDYFW